MESLNQSTENQLAITELPRTTAADCLPRSWLQRGLVLAQQLKDTATIGLMLANGMLIFGIIGGIAIPGLVLYIMRWKLVGKSGKSGRSLWIISLLHELFWMVLFAADHPHLSDMSSGHYEGGYALGACICALGLFELSHGITTVDEP